MFKFRYGNRDARHTISIPAADLNEALSIAERWINNLRSGQTWVMEQNGQVVSEGRVF